MKNFKILYVDRKDESQAVLNSLLKLNFDIRWTDTIYDARILVALDEYNLVITEIDLEDGSGLDFAKELKEKYGLRVILLSSKRDPEDLIKAIELNIIKYLTKPVQEDELKSAIEKYTKELSDANAIKGELTSLGNGFIYNATLQSVVANDSTTVSLTQQELKLIQALIQHKGSYCGHDVLQEAMGGDTGKPVTIDTLRTVIRKIRKKTYEEIIESLSGVGYKINISISKERPFIETSVINKLDKKILIVKSNEKNSNQLKKKLEHYGFTCEQAFFLSEAKDALKYEVFDYVVLDLHLSDGDGVELIRDKREVNSNKIIVLSSSEDMHYKEYLYYRGIIDYIEKHDDIDYLAYSIYLTISKIESNHIYNNILVIESSKKIAEQIKDILLPRNYEIDIISTSNKAFDIIKYKSYNLIIIDLESEGVDSIEFLIELKKQVDRALPIIMLSGTHRNYSVVRECYVNGAVECLRKPIFAEEFILKIDQWTEYYKQTLEIKDQHRMLNAYKNIVDHTVIVSKTDSKGVITYVNEPFCEISGYSKDELIGKPHNIVRHPETESSVFEDMWRTIKEEKRIWHGVLKNRKKDGTYYIVSTYIMPILDYNDDVIEYIALRNDITDAVRGDTK